MDEYKPKFAHHNKRDHINDSNFDDSSSYDSDKNSYSEKASNFFKKHQRTISIGAGIVIALIAVLIIILVIYKFVLAPRKKVDHIEAGNQNVKNNPNNPNNQKCSLAAGEHSQQQNKANFVNRVDPKLQSAIAKRDALLKQKEIDIAKQNDDFYNQRLNDIRESQRDSSAIVDVDDTQVASNNTPNNIPQHIYDDSDNVSEIKIEDLPNDDNNNNNTQTASEINKQVQSSNDLF